MVACLEGASTVAAHLAPKGLREQLQPLHRREQQLQETLARMLRGAPDTLAVFDAQLGWRPRPGLNNGIDVINSRGLRSAREYAPYPPPGVRRIAVFGDSFVYGSEVSGEEAWPAQLERMLPGLEVLNFGVPGYGPDQAYLRFVAEAQSVHPAAALFAVATPALNRVLTVSAAFQEDQPHFLAKPRFELDENDELVRLANPLEKLDDMRRFIADPSAIKEFGAHDYWYEPLVYENPLYDYSHTLRLSVTLWGTLWRRYIDRERPLAGGPGRGVLNSSSRAFRILGKIIEGFVKLSQEGGMQPLVLLLPDGFSVLRSRARNEGILDPLARWCTAQGIPYLDGTQAFQDPSTDPELWFVNRFHFSPDGNARVAQWVARELDPARGDSERALPRR